MGSATRFGPARWGPMAKARKLKVFKTPIGFHDAYVAAPSRAAALRAWGAGTDLFSAGIAEEVNEKTAAAKAVLSKPGEVVRVARVPPKDGKEAGSRIKSGMTKTVKATPRPSRAAVDKAEAALTALAETQGAEQAALAKEEEQLAKRRRALQEKHEKATAAAEARRDAAKARYRTAMAEWMG